MSVPALRTLAMCTATPLVVPHRASRPATLPAPKPQSRPRPVRHHVAQGRPAGTLRRSRPLQKDTQPGDSSSKARIQTWSRCRIQTARHTRRKAGPPGAHRSPVQTPGGRGQGHDASRPQTQQWAPCSTLKKHFIHIFLRKGEKREGQRKGVGREKERKKVAPHGDAKATEKRDADAVTSQREFPPGPREIADILPPSTSQAGISWDPTWPG